jgi:hypothetical protein
VDQVVESFLKTAGPFGAIVVLLGYWVWRLESYLLQVQEKRVDDAFKLADVARACESAIDRNTETLKGLLED